MNEVKQPKRPLIYYYGLMLLLLMLFNFLFNALADRTRQIHEVDYNTFVTMVEEGDVGAGRGSGARNNRDSLYQQGRHVPSIKTGMMPDTELIPAPAGCRCFRPGRRSLRELPSWLYFLLTWGLPLILLIGFGQFMSKKMMDKAGGPNSMMFGLGKSNAKVYVKSSARHQILRCGRRGRSQGEPDRDCAVPA